MGRPVHGLVRWWSLVLLIWLIVLPLALVLLSWLLQRKDAGESVLVVDRATAKLYVPTGGQVIAAADLFQVVEVIRWAEDAHHWKPVVQTSLVVAIAEGGFEVIPIVTQVRPNRFAMPLADRLADVFGVPVLRVQLDAEESRGG